MKKDSDILFLVFGILITALIISGTLALVAWSMQFGTFW